MEKITLADVKDIIQYEKIRKQYRQQIIDLKKNRRVSVGDRMTFVFENKDTMLFQIQEMMRAERMVEDNVIEHEIETFNALVPDANQLSATLLIEIQQGMDIKENLDSLIGLGGTNVFLTVGDVRIPAEFEAGHSTETRISAVQYIRFSFNQNAKIEFMDKTKPASIVITHPRYQHKAEIPASVRASLIQDLV
jgi:hypothetical protein